MCKKHQIILDNDKFYTKRKENAKSKISSLKSKMNDVFKQYEISIFVVGSIGRYEVGDNSDLDIFILSKNKINKLDQYKIYSKLIDINNSLSFPEFSNDGQFLTIHELNNLKNFTGSPSDDSLNLFTTRMLMILESKVLFNEKLYYDILDSIITHYFRDRNEADTYFKPLFLLNDILRFWRTLCLNYEAIRHNSDKPWRKKNINLKYSRMLTIFSTVLAIVVKKDINNEEILEICSKTPLERVVWSLDNIDDDFEDSLKHLLEYYKIFLEAKENKNIEDDVRTKKILNENAEKFSDIIFSILTHSNIDNKLKKYLMI